MARDAPEFYGLFAEDIQIDPVPNSFEQKDREQDLIDLFDSTLQKRFDTEVVGAELYVDALLGDDDDNSGESVDKPLKTLRRARQFHAADSGIKRNVNLAAGTYTADLSWGDIENLKFTGALSTFASLSVSSIASAGVTNGMQVTVGAGMTVDFFRGKLAQWTSGTLDTQYGIIYKNDGTDVWITQDTLDTAFKLPAALDTLDVMQHDSFVDLQGVTKFTRNGNFFQWVDLKIGEVTDTIQVNFGSTTFIRCDIQLKQLTIGEGSRVVTQTSYVANKPSATSLQGAVALLNQGRWGLTAGSVVDMVNAAASRAFLTASYESNVVTVGECVFRDVKVFDVKGAQIQKDLLLRPDASAIWRIMDGVSFIESCMSVMDLPDLYGNISGEYVITGDLHTFAKLGPNSEVTTAGATNAVSANGGTTNVATFHDLTQIRGGFPAANGTRCVKIDFQYDTPSPLVITTHGVDELLEESVVVFETAFNGTSPTVSLGTPATPGLIFDTAELKPKRADQYQSPELFTTLAATTIQLTLVPSTSSAGGGFVTCKLKQV